MLVGAKDNHMPLDQHSPCTSRGSNVTPLAYKLEKLRLSYNTCVSSDVTSSILPSGPHRLSSYTFARGADLPSLQCVLQIKRCWVGVTVQSLM